MKDSRRAKVTEAIRQACVSAIIRTDNEVLAGDAMQAAVDGGFQVVEFTLTTPGALSLVERFSAGDALTVGAGTVMSPGEARDAVSAGAEFLVSPIFDAEVLVEAAKLDVPMIPGCYTPTEMETAHRHGADFIKVFPAPAGGVGFIRAVRGPLPHLPLFPTAGPTPENFIEYLEAGCAGVGFVRSLFDPNDLARGDLAAVGARANEITRRLADWRSTPAE
ncbi:MAG: bifunctional 4-hydroxy-2-oxoglutarate aldolase/2-dehydro-3-deoxy-phosphogluconate aldolase [Planctomycetes bacterium]|nr:bifunctional 4-hydroxy-2-oxoglutarate aldolase/2-dehydro-3-deoxy-phosphogluconate aldolase [Planctomycetota bacterium]